MLNYWLFKAPQIRFIRKVDKYVLLKLEFVKMNSICQYGYDKKAHLNSYRAGRITV